MREVAAPLQFHLPQHVVDAEGSGLFQDSRMRDHVLPSPPQYSADAAEMKCLFEGCDHFTRRLAAGEGLAVFGDPVNNAIVDFYAAQECAS
nr:unnamed protein product [Spirometra erinaceieuropaei]